MKKQIACWSCYLLLFVGSSCQRVAPPAGKSVFRYNESAGISSLDPAFARDQACIWACSQLHCGLLQFDDQLDVNPSIAKNWELAPDKITYIFHLRNDVFFHDDSCFVLGKGRRVTAGDFAYSLQRLTDASLASPGSWVMKAVNDHLPGKGITALNDSTLQITLKKPFPAFIKLLCMPYCSVIPHEGARKYGIDFGHHPVGAGPFRFGMWKPGIKLVLLRNPHFFEKGAEGQLPYLDAVAINFIPDKQSAFLEFIKGNLDFLSGIDASYKDEILTRQGTLRTRYQNEVILSKQPYLNTEYLGIVMDTNKLTMKITPLRLKKVRQAINFGIDRARMMKYLRNNIGMPGIHGIVPPGMPGYPLDEVKGYNYQPDLAKQLLSEAGFPGGKGLSPMTLSTNPSYLDLCKAIQSQLGEIGIPIKIDVVPPASLRQMMAMAKSPFFRASWIADYPEAENYLALFYSPNRTPAGPNYTCTYLPEFDRKYQQAINEPSETVRNHLYAQLDNQLMGYAPVVVLYYDEVLRFTHPGISGLEGNPLNILYLKTVRKKP